MPLLKPACVDSIFSPTVWLNIRANRSFTFWSHYMESTRFHCEVLGPTQITAIGLWVKPLIWPYAPLDTLGVWFDSTHLDLYTVNYPEPFLWGLKCCFRPEWRETSIASLIVSQKLHDLNPNWWLKFDQNHLQPLYLKAKLIYRQNVIINSQEWLFGS